LTAKKVLNYGFTECEDPWFGLESK